MFWRYLARPVLFSLPPESVHHWSMSLFHAMMFPPVSGMLHRLTHLREPCLKSSVFGIDFENPVGLAAGFDKQATWFNSLSHLGFSHIEVGTITGEGQTGNPKPRLFRLPRDMALINRMGFNNVGAGQAAQALAKTEIKPVVGINIGKTRVVDVDKSVADYVNSFRLLHPYAHYFAVNVSSPNTPGLRTLQDREPLTELLTELLKQNQALSTAAGRSAPPLLLKIAPDLNDEQVADIAALASELSIDGIIATNTTIARDGLETSGSILEKTGAGGLSGKPLTTVSKNMVRKLYVQTDRNIPVIGVGGIMNGDDAWNMIRAGASLVQVYTGFIYGGPMFVRRINKYLVKMIRQHELGNIADAIGADA